MMMMRDEGAREGWRPTVNAFVCISRRRTRARWASRSRRARDERRHLFAHRLINSSRHPRGAGWIFSREWEREREREGREDVRS